MSDKDSRDGRSIFDAHDLLCKKVYFFNKVHESEKVITYETDQGPLILQGNMVERAHELIMERYYYVQVPYGNFEIEDFIPV